MILKLGILVVILVVGGIIFSSEIQTYFPNTSSTGINSLETDVNTITTKSLESAEKKIGSSVDKVESKISDIGHQTVQTAENSINSSVDQVETKLSEIKQNSTEYVEEKISDKFSFLNPSD
ncbi:MAG TPA: hypothetical protein VMW74_03805 [Nitrosopumilaceae archaeon]|nr:hypothetical protein [Nitrosopumilaceae archaeon]